jgi:NADH:ubiquinone oxidoreductase subunit 4 (subunit M)
VFPLVTGLALWGALMIGALYMLRAMRNVLHGPMPGKWSNISDASNVWRKLPYALLLASLLIFGCFPRLLTEKITPDAGKIVKMVMENVGGVVAGDASSRGRESAPSNQSNSQRRLTSAATKLK